jgi:hypothetical protein
MEAGASRFGREAKAPLVHTEKQLETTSNISAAQWLKNQKTPEETWNKRVQLHNQVVDTLASIMDRHRDKPITPEGELWLSCYSAQKERMEGEEGFEAWDRAREWAKKNKAPRELNDRLRWERAYGQVRDCQKEWIVYKAACCSSATRPVAVPVGCNHRLCPFCARRRSELARARLQVMYDRFTHPQFLTLTIPNTGTIAKSDFHLFRKRVRQLLKQYDGYVRGGVLSLETTYNRDSSTWHLHAHVLFDAACALPTKTWAIDLNGHRELAFALLKKRIEFDWLRLWTPIWGKPPRKRKSRLKMEFALQDERLIFESWLGLCWENKTHTWDRDLKHSVRIAGLSDEEFMARMKWNARNRRVVDLRGVNDRDKAVKEVLKYITKVAQFSDLPEAMELFSNATRGARLIQSFGSWYGVEVAPSPTAFDVNHLEDGLPDYSKRQCMCGQNHWERVPGTFFSYDVQMESTGQWKVSTSVWFNQCRSTVSRPTIRALARAPGKEEVDGITDTYDAAARASTPVQF